MLGADMNGSGGGLRGFGGWKWVGVVERIVQAWE